MSTPFRSTGHRVTLAATALLACATHVDASVPTEPPVFSDPTQIDNAYMPIQPDAVKVFRGKSDGERFVVTHLHLSDTRTFMWNGAAVETRVVKEIDFEAGDITEISLNYFAQADDGSVYYFGETVDDFNEGEIVGHEGSWLVGGKTAPTDPDETYFADKPALFMPANPELGDSWKPEDLFPFVDETVTVIKVDSTQKIAAGKFNAIRLKETSDIPGSDSEHKWWSKGVGVIRTKGEGERIALISSTLREQDDAAEEGGGK